MKQRSQGKLLPLATIVAFVVLSANLPGFCVPGGLTAPQVGTSLTQSHSKPLPMVGLTGPGSVPAYAASAPEEEWAGPLTILATTALAAVALRASETEAEPEKKSSIFDAIKLPLFTGLWYFFNIQYNLANKQVLNVFPATWALAWWQLAAGIPIAGFMWLSGLLAKPKVTKGELATLLPVGAAHSAGQILTVASLGAVAVSFTHTVKALEPGVNAIASGLLLGQVFHPFVYLSLVPVFAGVAMASAGEMSFTMFGFLTAFGSNFAFVLRNVLSTKFGSVGQMGDDAVTRKTNQLSVLTTVAALVLLPFVVFIPGGLLEAPAAWDAAMSTGIAPFKMAMLIIMSGFHFFMYQMSSFWVLSCVQPITHSVLNTLKRIVIIIVSVIVFRNPVSVLSGSGTLVAIGGVLLYSLTKQHYAKKAKAAAA
jgi:solute carrier family 35 protein E1